MFPKLKLFHKPLVVLLSLLAIIAVSMLTITVSAYVKTLPFFGDGWVGPKYFSFNIQSNGETKALAPSETISYDFNVYNHNENGVAQIPLHISIEIHYPSQLAGTGTIQAKLFRGGTLLASDDGSGVLAVMGNTLPASVATTDVYTLTLTWLDTDMTYLSEMRDDAFDPSKIVISVSAYQ